MVLGKKVSTVVTEYIIKEIKNGHYQLGCKLPSERELMQIINAGRSSVREALNTLADLGVLEKRMGIGVFVKKTDLTTLVDSFVVSALLDTKISNDLLEFRLILEVEAAGIAALKATEKELASMEEAIAIHLEAIEQNKPTLEADELFHKAIVLATQNKIIQKVYHQLSDLLYSFRNNLLKVESKQKSLQYHKDIYKAIKEGDKDEAKSIMKEHILEVTERYMHINDFQKTTAENT
ncbi:FadR/GntR family transcriptional regulator [Neobacillus muris]|uniref:FadR/GntR family transcriptional regulator n=1 Tax=Neobacillus muris TaxID=2941334 RepID=UPI00203B6939|nr:FadR/GntR family transcriptional regulator [Neobacillus muris]